MDPTPPKTGDIIAPRTSRFGLVALATFVISFSVLSFEVVLTRIFSVMLSYHFVFAIVSLALLGLGLGGMLLAKWKQWFSGASFHSNAALLAVSIVGSVLMIVTLPIFEHPAFANFRLWIYFFLALVPFFFAGLTFADLFRTYAARSSVLYGFDLLGATLGALAVVALLDRFGGVQAALITAAIATLGATMLAAAAGKVRRLHYIVSLVVAVPLLVAFLGKLDVEVPITMDANKDLYRFLNSPSDSVEVVESRWSSFGRTDLVRSPLSPEQMNLFVDGAAGSAMYNLALLQQDEELRVELLGRFGEFFPFYFLNESEKDNALIIGSGGGRDVVVALLGEVKSITAVEVNPDVVELVSNYADFNGGIYTDHPNVRIVVQEGRNYLRATEEQFDLIMLALPVTKSSRSVKGYALTENYLFTVEAMDDYLDHLTPEGRLILVTHNTVELYRLVVLTLTAFKDRGVAEDEAMQYIYSIDPGSMPTLVVKNQPFDSLEAGDRHALIHFLSFDQGNYFVPFVPRTDIDPVKQLDVTDEWRMFDQVLVEISRGNLSLETLVESTVFDLRPVTDDSPFFYKFEPGLPRPFGLFAVLIVVLTGLVVGLVSFHSRYATSSHPLLKDFAMFPLLNIFLLIFFLLGVGFMLLEIAFFQKLTLYLAQPVLALSVLLFALLLGTGLGSLCSAIATKHLSSVIIIAALLVVTLTLIYDVILPALFDSQLDPRLAATLFLLPLGFFLGFPFPLSIRLMKDHGLERFVDRMWGLNGIASVAGSALAMIIGIMSGFSTALYLGAVLYGTIALLAFFLSRQTHVAQDPYNASS
ncbi:MAG: hypothetical protein BMS9Abin05_2077 [Rhodothermia bacterium]|nr:MAG: hypothetical protein BMS9Abin05_2077 [Rhodothermia bacterium]